MKKLADTVGDAVTNGVLVFLAAAIARLGWQAGTWLLTKL